MRRLLVFVSATVLLESTFFAVLAPLLPYYEDEFGLSTSALGALSAVYSAGALAGAIPSGLLAVRVGVKPTVLGGLVIIVATSVAFGLADSAWVLYAARFGQGVGSALAWTGGLAWLIAAAPRERRGDVIRLAMGAAPAGGLRVLARLAGRLPPRRHLGRGAAPTRRARLGRRGDQRRLLRGGGARGRHEPGHRPLVRPGRTDGAGARRPRCRDRRLRRHPVGGRALAVPAARRGGRRRLRGELGAGNRAPLRRRGGGGHRPGLRLRAPERRVGARERGRCRLPRRAGRRVRRRGRLPARRGALPAHARRRPAAGGCPPRAGGGGGPVGETGGFLPRDPPP